MKLEAPQITYFIITAIGLASAGYLHGKPKTGKYSLVEWFVNFVITFSLLYWGGFFG